ncbi:MAG TPA: bifunctional response regulator/alkaline phosphatase family protein [Chitinivibrionales bacterium]|nr:bifunctional response regulator/alkaline phosphatase family protein [Chitinivibrionales bacterium]
MSGTRKKVLWADDEIEFLRAHIMFLETRGYSVTPVFSGHDAIHLIQENPKAFDIVLLDEQMPGKDGLTTLEEIKEMVPDLPVVMVTKSEEEHLMDEALGKKIDGYLTKPVNPSQILSVCKKLLDSKQIISTQITQKFVRSYSDIRLSMSTRMTAKEWTTLFDNLTKWDLELEKVEDEGLRQAHAGQKSDCNTAFGDFIAENYVQWLKGENNPPLLSPGVVEAFLVPRLREGKKVYFVVLDCMRLDQYCAIELLLRKYFDIERNYFFSILPTATPFARNALFAGKFPLDIAQDYPELWKTPSDDESSLNRFERQLLARKLKGCGLDFADDPKYVKILDASDSKEFLKKIGSYEKDRLVSIVVNFVDMLTHSRSTSTILQEIAPDEAAFRSLTQSWFQFSNIFAILKEFAAQDCTVILTTDHGSTLCTRGTEVYGSRELSKNLRYKFGENITCDERHALFLSDPTVFRLPAFSLNSYCIIARENYYFVYPDKFENFQKQYQNSFQHGGISMEEIIIPLAVMKPK